jgi:hypothetical protein
MFDDNLTGETRYRETPCGFVVELEYAFIEHGKQGWQFGWRNANAADLCIRGAVIMHNESD